MFFFNTFKKELETHKVHNMRTSHLYIINENLIL